MKKYILTIFILTLLSSCSSKEGNVKITAKIDGLKTGTIYLQKVQDKALVNIDSIVIDGDADFMLYTHIEEPEVHYLYLDKKDGNEFNDRIAFFAEPGEINITTTVRDFEEDAKIIGGKNEMKFQEFKAINKRFSQRRLRIFNETIEASQQSDDELLKNNTKYKQLLKRKYLYIINFAITNKDLEVAPYVIMNEVFDANIKYLDTVANSLTSTVRKSLYGKQLTDYITERKTKEVQ